MLSAKNLINESLKEVKIADYIIQVTSKVVKDKKIAISSLMHLKKSIMLGIKAYLAHLKEQGKIKNVFSGDELIYNYFMDNFSNKLLDRNLKNAIEKIMASNKSYDLRGMILEKNSKYSFISEGYELISVSNEEIKRFIKLILNFIKELDEKINKT